MQERPVAVEDFLMDALGSNPFQLRFNVWASGTQTGHEAPASWISSNELPEPRVEDLSSQGQANLAARYEAAQN